MTKGKMFKNVDPYSFLSPSAYETAWLAMIPADFHKPSQPMFKNCLDWVLNNQHGEGFWGECDAFGKPTNESLPATLASLIALKKWNTGTLVIKKGLSFIEANAGLLLKDMTDNCPPCFAIIFTGMVELAETVGLGIVFPEGTVETVSSIFSYRNIILQKEELAGKQSYPPLLLYLEALPPPYAVSEEDLSTNLSDDGSLFQSPSATAKAFMDTKKKECLAYLQSLVHRCPNGVPQSYPMDEDLIKLSMVNHLQRLGLAEKFPEEIEEILETIYRNYLEQESWVKPANMIEPQLQKDALAFQLLRMHGYKISPCFCWFLHLEEIRAHIEKDYEGFTLAMVNIYRASSLMFYGESVLEEAKSLSRKILEKTITVDKWNQPHQKFSRFHNLVEHELNLPWLARLDHLEHRMWIDEKEANALWKGKLSYNRISCYHNKELVQLAVQNYEFMQSIFKVELEELKRWSENWGLPNMGFAREKTTYCYFAIAAATYFSHDSYVRMFVAKCAVIITVVDDFFDKEGTLSELEGLTGAVRRWDSKGLKGHSKVLFDFLDALVSEAATKYLQEEGIDIKESLKDLWRETFVSWLVEAKWARNGHTPSLDDYIKIGMISIAVHTIVLPASCFLNSSLPNHKLRPAQYETITKLLMVTCRLLNDLQSYQKEKEEGKMNCVLMNLVENPESNIEDSISLVGEIIDKKKKELLEHALIDGHCDLPKASKHLHLSCLKVFQMFFNSSNLYDSDTELLQDINKAIYLPVHRDSKPVTVASFHSGPKKKKAAPLRLSNINWHFNHTSRKSFIVHQISLPAATRNGYGIVALAQKVVLGID